ncbi:MAG: hypothetical protein H6574_01080 [Lewinellaceae bacterium]|nr:hypothetical protein [Saprospiraceae bacterium]MCB9329649.1 hypothetical protein [Lewinellaceae bacterium]
MATLTYHTNGVLLDRRDNGPDMAIFGNIQVPLITASQLQRYAAIVYAEAAYSALLHEISPRDPRGALWRETVAIAIAMYNYVRNKSMAFYRAGRIYNINDLVNDAAYVKGINSPKFNEYFMPGGDETKRTFANLAVLKLFTRQVEDIRSIIFEIQQAAYWDGNDIFRRYREHYRAKQGFELGNPEHGRLYQNVTIIPGTQVIDSCPAQDPRVAAYRQFTFLSTMTAGGSIFYRIHPQAVAQGVTW